MEMNRVIVSVAAVLMISAAGLFWWQAEAGNNLQPLVAQQDKAPAPTIPQAGDAAARGPALPRLPQADSRTREQKRFDHMDRDRNGSVSREEMLASRINAFRKLDKDGNNLLSFEEWAVRTTDRFAQADADQDGRLSPAEYATTAPKKAARKPDCATRPRREGR